MTHPLIPETNEFPASTRRLAYADITRPEVRHVWDGLGFVQDNFFRMLAHAPTLVGALGSLVHGILGELELDARHRELAIMHVNHVRNVRSTWAWHVDIALTDGGISREQLFALQRGDIASSIFSNDDRAVLRFVDELLLNGAVCDDSFEAVGARLSSRQLMELMIITGAYAMFGNIMETAEIQIEWESADPLHLSPRH